MAEIAYCGSSEPHAEHEVGGVGRMGPFTTTCEGILEPEPTAAVPDYDPGPTVIGPRGWPVPVRTELTEPTAAEVVAALSEAVIFPRFLGIDGGGSFVWELEDGRWTWGEDPHDAINRARTFEPERYIEKYEAPTPIRKVER